MSNAKRDLLRRYLSGEINQKPTSPQTINRRAPGNLPQPSFGQERLWFLDQLMPDSPVFNIPIAVRLSTPLDLVVLEQSLNEIVRRHDALSTTFATVDGQPKAVIAPNLILTIPVIDLGGYPQDERETEARRLTNEEALRPFDLVQGPLVRVSLIRLGEDAHVLLVTTHHIISDAWSTVVFFEELSRLYEAFSKGEPSPLPELPIEYADYAAWQREWVQGEQLEKQLSYWKKSLGGELPVLDLATDRPRPSVQTHRGARESLLLSENLTEAIVALSQREGATLFMTLLAAFKVLLFRHTGLQDIIVGSPIASRPQPETEGLIGFFLNNLALRTDLSGNPNFREVLARVRETALEAYANQDVPFEKIVEELRPERHLSRTPLFQVYLNLFNFNDELKLPASTKGISFFEAWLKSDENLSKFDLTLYAGLQGGELKLALVYNVDLFDAASITRMLGHFRTLLEGAVANPERSISDYPLRTEAERTRDFIRSNSVRPVNPFITFARHEIEQSIADRFESQVRKFPSHIAVKSRSHEWSYEELNRSANRVCQTILSLRGEGEERIALLLEHDAPMIAALLGTLKAGKTYVPLDPLYPRERLAYILADSQAGALLTNDENLPLAQKLTGDGVQLINIDHLDSAAPVAGALNIPPDRLAYILYTSGSTGKPKGVMQNHRNVLHFIRVYTNNLHINSDDRLTLLSSYCFDAAVMDIYGALLNGATLYLVHIREEGLAYLSDLLTEEAITIYHSTPTVYRYYVKTLSELSEFPQLRLLVLGGEEVNRRDVELYKKHFSDECLLVNGFGPTEATVSLQYFIDKQTEISGHSVPIGYPVDDTEVLLLDPAGKPADICGEIAIKCPYVALGYWRNAVATNAAFLSNWQGAGSHIYRTGDMGRRLSEGSIEFEGRKDFQVKIRGFRIELGEVEAVLSEHPSIRESVVVTREDSPGEKRLVAYVVLLEEVETIISDLQRWVKQRLPDYMVPSAFMVLDEFPLTVTGKVDRRALPAPDGKQFLENAFVAPRNTLELLLTKTWEKVLEVQPIGVKDNFFELGGHSLLAVRLFAQIEKLCGKKLPLATLFQAPTVEQLASLLSEEKWAPTWSSLVPIQPGGAKPPLFCLHLALGHVLFYRDLAHRLGSDQPIYALQPQGLDGTQPRHTRIEEMASHYIKEMRALQPEGPYYLGGSSFGGLIAFEMAQQLHAQGQQVGLLALFDTYAPGFPKLSPEASSLRYQVYRFMQRVNLHLSNLLLLEPEGKVEYAREKAVLVKGRLKWRIKHGIENGVKKITDNLSQSNGHSVSGERQERRDAAQALREYVPQVYPGCVTLFRASNQPAGYNNDRDLGWGELAAGGVETHEIPGYHGSIVREPRVRLLAEQLQACLSQAQGSIS